MYVYTRVILYIMIAQMGGAVKYTDPNECPV